MLATLVQSGHSRVQTTLRVPKPLYEQARSLVEANLSAAENINDFIVNAIRAYVKMWRRKQIDAAFAGMVEDVDYQKEALMVAADFEQSDWETLDIGERQAH